MSTQDPVPPRILPPHLFVAAVVAIGVLGLTTTAPIYSVGVALPIRILCTIVVVAMVLFAMSASRQFSKAGTNIIPLTKSTTLVSDGAFRFSRNPMYLGMIVTVLALAIATNNWLTLVVPVVFFIHLRQKFVLREEPLMAATFGEAYLTYKRKVRRWL